MLEKFCDLTYLFRYCLFASTTKEHFVESSSCCETRKFLTLLSLNDFSLFLSRNDIIEK